MNVMHAFSKQHCIEKTLQNWSFQQTSKHDSFEHLTGYQTLQNQAAAQIFRISLPCRGITFMSLVLPNYGDSRHHYSNPDCKVNTLMLSRLQEQAWPSPEGKTRQLVKHRERKTAINSDPFGDSDDSE